MTPSRMKGESLVLPNLKLKVLIEAIRMVLEIVYDERFVTLGSIRIGFPRRALGMAPDADSRRFSLFKAH